VVCFRSGPGDVLAQRGGQYRRTDAAAQHTHEARATERKRDEIGRKERAKERKRGESSREARARERERGESGREARARERKEGQRMDEPAATERWRGWRSETRRGRDRPRVRRMHVVEGSHGAAGLAGPEPRRGPRATNERQWPGTIVRDR
jgi:hypothetical protein